MRIFEPFFTTKAWHGGAGLGLATVGAIVEQSCGAVCVESQPGFGTEFRLYLPCCERAEPLTVLRATPASRGCETILLVEDEAQVRMLTRSLLDRWGYRVLTAGDACDALRICEQTDEKIDLLLTDVVLPRMHGCQLADQVRRLRPGIRVLFMSGHTDDAIRRRGLRASAAFIEKPLRRDVLLGELRDVLDAPV
jgi:two-component system, cell cycle sensor histidine kinase and response regulator CckA